MGIDIFEARQNVIEKNFDAGRLPGILEFPGQRGLNGAALFVAKHDKQRSLQMNPGVLQRSGNLRPREGWECG